MGKPHTLLRYDLECGCLGCWFVQNTNHLALTFIPIDELRRESTTLMPEAALFIGAEITFRGTVAECFAKARELDRCDWLVQEWIGGTVGWAPVDKSCS
jgi:hypothetical protein